MKYCWLCISLSLACSTNPGVQPVLGNPNITSAKVDSVVRHAKSEGEDRARRSAQEQANLAAMSVDTILVRPESLELAAGSTISLFSGPISWTAQDHGGNRVPGFAPWFRVDNSRVLTLRGDDLVSLAPGRAALLLTVATRSDSQPPRILHVTRVSVVVH